MNHFINTKIPKLGIFVDKNSQNGQTPFPKVGRKTPGKYSSCLGQCYLPQIQYKYDILVEIESQSNDLGFLLHKKS